MPIGPSRWQSEELRRTFLEGMRGAIPGAEPQFAVIGKMLGLWRPEPEAILDPLVSRDGVAPTSIERPDRKETSWRR